MPKGTEGPEFNRYHGHYEDLVKKSIWFTGVSYKEVTRLKSQHIHQVVEKHFGGAKVSLLDIGCGAGAIHSFLEKSFERIEGIDPSSSMLSMAEEKNPRCHYRVNTESTLPYSNGSFEVTLSICVLHHILAIDQKKFIEEMVRVTKPGGLVLVLEHNPFNPVTRYIFSHNEIDATASLIYPKKLTELFQLSKVDDCEARYLGFLPIKPVYALEKYLAPVPLGAQYLMIGKKKR